MYKIENYYWVTFLFKYKKILGFVGFFLMLVLSECVVLYVCRAKLCAGVIDPVRVCLFVCLFAC